MVETLITYALARTALISTAMAGLAFFLWVKSKAGTSIPGLKIAAVWLIALVAAAGVPLLLTVIFWAIGVPEDRTEGIIWTFAPATVGYLATRWQLERHTRKTARAAISSGA